MDWKPKGPPKIGEPLHVCCFCCKPVEMLDDWCEQGSDAEVSHQDCCPLCQEEKKQNG